MTAFAAAINAMFADRNLAADASWSPRSGGPPILCRVIVTRPDTMSTFGDSQITSDTMRLDVRIRDVAEPQRGDEVTIGPETFILQGEPRRDRLRLVWQCEACPIC